MGVYQVHEGPDYMGAAKTMSVFNVADAVESGMKLATEMTLAQNKIAMDEETMRANAVMRPLQIQKAQMDVAEADQRMKDHAITNSAEALQAQASARIAEDKARLRGLQEKADIADYSKEISDVIHASQNDPGNYLSSRVALDALLGTNMEYRKLMASADAQFDQTAFVGSDGQAQTGAFLRNQYGKGEQIDPYRGTLSMSVDERAVAESTQLRQVKKAKLLAQGFDAPAADQMLSVEDATVHAAALLGMNTADVALAAIKVAEGEFKGRIARSIPGVAVDEQAVGKFFGGEKALGVATDASLLSMEADLDDRIANSMENNDDPSTRIQWKAQRSKIRALRAQIATGSSWINTVLAVGGPGPVVGSEGLAFIRGAANWWDYGSSGIEDRRKFVTVANAFKAAYLSGDEAAKNATLKDYSKFLYSFASKQYLAAESGRQKLKSGRIFATALGQMSGATGGSALANPAPVAPGTRLTTEGAKVYLQRANGNRAVAEEMAAKDNYTF